VQHLVQRVTLIEVFECASLSQRLLSGPSEVLADPFPHTHASPQMRGSEDGHYNTAPYQAICNFPRGASSYERTVSKNFDHSPVDFLNIHFRGDKLQGQGRCKLRDLGKGLQCRLSADL
jgi:hypothetical protein